MSASVKITVTSDFICPWCYIGEQRLSRAIENLPVGIDVELSWLPFELNPGMPTEGLDRKAYRSRKFGSWEHSRALDAKTVEAGRPERIAFDYDAITKTPNTFAAHRLSLLARRSGVQSAYVAAVLKAYFAEGRDIGDSAILADIASEIGLDRETVLGFLASDAEADEVRALEQFAQERGIHGVPNIEIGGTTISGAQPVAILRQAILDAAASGSAAPSGAQAEGSVQ